jgi:UDP-N-acetylmuramyl pentapeptide phosphotransferase/UDP-N-acetylglucosamine-1-phosphate transferase
MGRGWVAPPIQARDLHKIPLPRLGDIAIFLAVLMTVTVAFSANRRHVEGVNHISGSAGPCVE